MSRIIRDAIVSALRRVDGIGTVHDRERYAARQEDFRRLYMDEAGIVKGWFVALDARAESRPALGRHNVTYRWRLHGYRSFDDEVRSEILFAQALEAVAAALRADDTLGGTVFDISAPSGDETGLQIDTVEAVMFAGVLCHQARCRLTTRSLLG